MNSASEDQNMSGKGIRVSVYQNNSGMYIGRSDHQEFISVELYEEMRERLRRRKSDILFSDALPTDYLVFRSTFIVE